MPGLKSHLPQWGVASPGGRVFGAGSFFPIPPWCFQDLVLPRLGASKTWCFQDLVLPRLGASKRWTARPCSSRASKRSSHAQVARPASARELGVEGEIGSFGEGTVEHLGADREAARQSINHVSAGGPRLDIGGGRIKEVVRIRAGVVQVAAKNIECQPVGEIDANSPVAVQPWPVSVRRVLLSKAASSCCQPR